MKFESYWIHHRIAYITLGKRRKKYILDQFRTINGENCRKYIHIILISAVVVIVTFFSFFCYQFFSLWFQEECMKYSRIFFCWCDGIFFIVCDFTHGTTVANGKLWVYFSHQLKRVLTLGISWWFGQMVMWLQFHTVYQNPGSTCYM